MTERPFPANKANPMSQEEYHDRQSNHRQLGPSWPRPWNCVRTVRQREEVSLNALARRTRLKESELERLEDENCDLPVSMLYRLAEGLRVPVEELLPGQKSTISEPIRQRASLLRIARTAHTILAKSKHKTTRHLAQTLVDQLTALMPELSEAGTWPEVGKWRSPTDVPRMEEQLYSAFPSSFRDPVVDLWDHASLQDSSTSSCRTPRGGDGTPHLHFAAVAPYLSGTEKSSRPLRVRSIVW